MKTPSSLIMQDPLGKNKTVALKRGNKWKITA